MKISAQVKKLMDDAETSSLTSGLEKCLVRLSTTVGTKEYTVGSATILYKEPGTKNTVLATSKRTFELYAQHNSSTRPTFNQSDTGFKSFVSQFNTNVKLVYGETLWSAPKAAPTTASIQETKFMIGDNSWDYDLCLLVSQDQALYNTSSLYSAWGDASSWKSQADIPRNIESYFAQAINNRTFMFGFGDPIVPYKSLVPKIPPLIDSTSITFQYSRNYLTIGPNPAVNTNTLQVCTGSLPDKKPMDSSSISVWPWTTGQTSKSYRAQPPYNPMTITSDFKPTRKFIGATLVGTTDDGVGVNNDCGGGVFVRNQINTGHEVSRFIGIISTINGTIETRGDFDNAFSGLSTDPPFKLYCSLQPYLPWPTSNQVVTLISPMLTNWPLSWPDPTHGSFTAAQTSQAANWIKDNAGNGATLSSAQTVINKLMVGKTQKGGWGATTSYLNGKMIYHASTGLAGSVGGVTIWFIARLDELGAVVDFQIYALGAHSDFKTSKCSSKKYSSSYLISAIVDTKNNKVSSTNQVSTQSIYDKEWNGPNIKINNQYCV